MKTEFVRIKASDGAIHHGLFFRPGQTAPEKAVAHIHGLAGNFYENGFIAAMAENYTSFGWGFLSFNNRGHDYMADIEKASGPERSSFKGGGAYERFEECAYDIAAGTDFLRNAGIRRVCLQGHSTGCNKIVHCLAGEKPENVYCAVLLSPCDDIWLMQKELGSRFAEGIRQAKTLLDEGRGDSLIDPGRTFYPMSARTYLDYYTGGSAHDIFTFRKREPGFGAFKKLNLPVLAIYGEEDEYLQIPAGEALERLRDESGDNKLVHSLVIKSARHDYFKAETRLASGIAGWLKEIGF